MGEPEEWRAVEGWPYEVSDLGRVRRKGCEAVLKHKVSKKGYRRVQLQSAPDMKYAYIHRLVAAAFIGPSSPGKQVNHKNGIKDDNRAKNLEWVTCAENLRHAVETGLLSTKGSKNPNARLSEEDIPVLRRMVFLGWSDGRISRVLGVSKRAICDVRRGRTWRHIPNPLATPTEQRTDSVGGSTIPTPPTEKEQP